MREGRPRRVESVQGHGRRSASAEAPRHNPSRGNIGSETGRAGSTSQRHLVEPIGRPSNTPLPPVELQAHRLARGEACRFEDWVGALAFWPKVLEDGSES